MRVQIENFQSLAEISLDVEGLTVVLGPSDVGKSAIIRAVGAALFNRPGDAFVRTGEKDATVTLTGVPTSAGPPLDVTWTKGARPAHYTINGESYGKVGATTPAPLKDAGYRDVDLRADAMRPQVAGQFDRIFLLEESGAVLADVLAAASTIDVFARAVDLCAADVRQETGAVAALTKHLAAAQAQADAHTAEWAGWLAPVQAWLSRWDAVAGARQHWEAVAALYGQVQRGRAIHRPIPPPAASATWGVLRGLLEAAHRVQASRAVPAVTVPPAAPDVAGVRQMVTAAQAVYRARQVPPVVSVPAAVDLGTVRQMVEAGRAVYRARQVAAVCAVPDIRVVGAAREWVNAWVGYQSAAQSVSAATAAVQASAASVETATSAQAAFWALHPECPVCRQRMPTHASNGSGKYCPTASTCPA